MLGVRSLFLLGLSTLAVFAPSASAADDNIVAVAAQFIIAETDLSTEDGDGVGATAGYSFQCACNCPVAGAGFNLGLLGQEISADGFTAFHCGNVVSVEANPGEADPNAEPSADPYAWIYIPPNVIQIIP